MTARTWSGGASRHWCPSLSSPDTRHTLRLTSHISTLSFCYMDTEGAPLAIAPVRDLTDHTKSTYNDALMIQLAAIVEHSDDAIIGATLDGVITSWNQAAERIYGYSSAEVIGKSVGLLSPDDRTGEIEAILAKIRAGQHVGHFETRRVRKDASAITGRPSAHLRSPTW
jgi:PAS domain S-box-containing protein